jgi:hypothetical protein
MKTSLKLLLVITVLLVLFWVLSALVGFLFWAIVITVIGALVAALARAGWDERMEKKRPGWKAERRADKNADKALKDLERKFEAERKKTL